MCAGRVLEIGDDEYTRRFGGDRVERSDVLHVEEGNPQATIVADLADAPQIPDDELRLRDLHADTAPDLRPFGGRANAQADPEARAASRS